MCNNENPTPKVGEVWGFPDGTYDFTCTDDEADSKGRYGWKYTMKDEGVVKVYMAALGMVRRPPTPPTFLTTHPWLTVLDGTVTVMTWSTSTVALFQREAIGAYNIQTGEWIPKK